jgi:hypothetical protein
VVHATLNTSIAPIQPEKTVQFHPKKRRNAAVSPRLAVVACAVAVACAAAGRVEASIVLPTATLQAEMMWEVDAEGLAAEQQQTHSVPQAVVQVPTPPSDWETLLAKLGRLSPASPHSDAGSGPASAGSHSTSSFALHHALSLPELLPLVGAVAVSDWADVPVGFRVDLLRPPRVSA